LLGRILLEQREVRGGVLCQCKEEEGEDIEEFRSDYPFVSVLISGAMKRLTDGGALSLSLSLFEVGVFFFDTKGG